MMNISSQDTQAMKNVALAGMIEIMSTDQLRRFAADVKPGMDTMSKIRIAKRLVSY